MSSEIKKNGKKINEKVKKKNIGTIKYKREKTTQRKKKIRKLNKIKKVCTKGENKK